MRDLDHETAWGFSGTTAPEIAQDRERATLMTAPVQKDAPHSRDSEIRCVSCDMVADAGDGALPRGWTPSTKGARCVRCSEAD